MYPKDAAGNPTDGPWFTSESIIFLETFIKKHTKILEFGSGRSTVWMSQRSDNVISIEDDPEWLNWVHKNAPNAQVMMVPLKNHPEVIDYFPDEHFDLIIIDADSPNPDEDTRVQCIEKAIRVLKKGGILFLDNAERAFHAPTIKRSKCDYTRILDLLDGWEMWFTNQRPAKQHGNWYTVWWSKP